MNLPTVKPPHLIWSLLEGRALFELGSFYALRPFLNRLPKGDEHPVLVLPGFMASDFSTKPLRELLNRLKYKSYGWELGRNVYFTEQREKEMGERLKDIYTKNGHQKVSIIGWSLGGLFARELAKTYPDIVRCVITLGSPISGKTDHSNAKYLFEALNGKPGKTLRERQKKLHTPPPVPCTSIYSKTDGVVAWQGSIQNKTPLTENIRVPASHLGMGVNPFVMFAIADRLSQKENLWQAFDLRKAQRCFFKAH